MLLAEGLQVAGDAASNTACKHFTECLAPWAYLEAGFPGLAGNCSTFSDSMPGGDDILRHEKRLMRPSDIGTGCGDFISTQRRAMGLFRTLQIRRTLADQRAASNERRFAAFSCPCNGSGNRLRIMAVNGLRAPACGLEAHQLVHGS